MFAGFVIGITSAVMQSVSYIFSRRFMQKHHDPVKMTVYSQLWMGVLSAAALLLISPYQEFPLTPRVLLLSGGFAFFGEVAYWCFFKALQEIEASRLSSLQGLKIIALAVVNTLLFREMLLPWQIVAIVLSSFAAVGINFSGGKLPWRGCIYLTVTMLCFVGTDITNSRVVAEMPGNSRFFRALAATAYCFGSLAIFSAPLLLKIKFQYRCFKDAFAYGASWFTAMVGLLASFDLLGVMLGTIVQASRGFFSVILGYILLKTRLDTLEPAVSGKMWLRRGIMAILMVAAMALYVRK